MKYSDSRRALIIIDVQASFLNDRNNYIVQNIVQLLNSTKYDLYIEATFHTEKGSLWDKQQQWICPESDKTKTIPILAEKLALLNSIKVYKETKSVFKGNIDVLKYLKNHGITDVHVVGLDTNDCVLATVFEAFDLGFITYALEDCCESSSSKELHEYAIKILRGQDMTQNN